MTTKPNDGWKIVGVWDTRGFFADAIVPTEGSPLKTPFEAAQHVLTHARLGNKACQEALRHVAMSNATRSTKPPRKKK